MTRIPDPADYRELHEGSALIAETESASDWMRLTGPDRLRFTNGLVTCDLRSLSPGSGAYGFFTDPKGRVVADGAFLELEDELWIELPAGAGSRIGDHLRKYVVADQVEIEEVRCGTLRLAGPDSKDLVASVLGLAAGISGWDGGRVEVEGETVLVRGERRLGVPAVVFAGPEAAVSKLRSACAAAGSRPVGDTAVTAVRIEHGIPWFARDFAPGSEHETGDGAAGFFPQETGIEDWAVSYEKGCYLGQEVIARIHFRGKVNRFLRGLLFEPDSKPAPDEALVHGEEIVGRVGSVGYSPLLERPVGLAITHRKAEPGSTVTILSGFCRLVELPFESSGRVPAGR